MTLTGDGYEIVFAGTHVTNADATRSTARIAIAPRLRHLDVGRRRAAARAQLRHARPAARRPHLLAGDAEGARDIFYIDPQRDFAVTVGHDSLSRMRGMGVGGLVLADGRVVLAGGKEPDGNELRAPLDVDLWEPPYLDTGARAARPTFAAVLGTIPIAAPFSIEMAKGSPAITEVVLLAYGSWFMGNNPNQRLVELAIERDGSDPSSPTIALRGPPAGWAPAGRYLLFALGDDRIPSVGVPVDVVEAGGGPWEGPERSWAEHRRGQLAEAVDDGAVGGAVHDRDAV
jgi:Domain of unknown function (DUF1929)